MLVYYKFKMSDTINLATFIPSDQYEPINEWYKALHPSKKVWVDDNWSSLLDGMLEYLQNSVNEIEEPDDEESVPKRTYTEDEDILSMVKNVDDLLEYTTIRPGEDGWTEAYRQYCRGKSESLPKLPGDGSFRVYAPTHQKFVSEPYEVGKLYSVTSYYQTMSGGDGTYAESGYFVTEKHKDGHCKSTEAYIAKRKPMGEFELTALPGGFPIITWAKMADRDEPYQPKSICIAYDK